METRREENETRWQGVQELEKGKIGVLKELLAVLKKKD